MRGATFVSIVLCKICRISIHTPHAGSDVSARDFPVHSQKFQSTLPMRGATRSYISCVSCDFYFNPHSPCGERPLDHRENIPHVRFQSTLPMRGATAFFSGFHILHFYFNPHSPCGERRQAFHSTFNVFHISIHTPHAGSDSMTPAAIMDFSRFQSTLPMRGATKSLRSFSPVRLYFNPHSPCGERHHACHAFPSALVISIHTPHAGSDSKSYRIHIKFKNKIYDIRNKNKL